MINWNEIDTVLLDMDGTLLDLHFDNYFWQEQLPQKWGELNGMDTATAKTMLAPIFKSTEATLPWYCLDFWSEQLEMDVFEISAAIENLIQLRPYVEQFLKYLAVKGKDIVLVTNSHEKFIDLKMQRTGLDHHFNHMFNAHSFGMPKEDPKFWKKLGENLSFREDSTVLIDDNLSVLRSAREHGIRHLLSIAQPNSRAAAHDTEEFQGVISFRDLCY
ncbi:MAG: HAD superfamily hydrolase (TIGR01509 family) [Gammaproteobacteria bacterium]